MTSYKEDNDKNTLQYESTKNISNIRDIVFEQYNEKTDYKPLTSKFDRKDHENFNKYYEKVLKNRIGTELLQTNHIFEYIQLMKNEQIENEVDIWNNFKKEEEINEIPNIHVVDTYIDMYKYRYRFRILKLIKICKIIFNEDNINKSLFSIFKQKYFWIGDKIQYKFLILIKNNDEYIIFINEFEAIIKTIEDKNYIEPDKKIETSKTEFSKDNFSNILSKDKSPDDFEKLNEVLNKDEEFNNYAVYHYSKFLFKLTKEERKNYEDNYNINTKYVSLKNKINNEDKDLYSIIDNFLVISSHLSYNLIQHDKIKKINENDENLALLNTRIRELFDLIIDNTQDDARHKIVGNTFEYHISDNYYEKTLESYRIVIKVFTNIISIKNEVNFTNNYLKQIVSMIYKQLNGEDINFNNNNETRKVSLSNNIESNENIDNNPKAREILNKANTVVNINFLLIYLFNLILLYLIFCIGKNNINFLYIKTLSEKTYNVLKNLIDTKNQ